MNDLRSAISADLVARYNRPGPRYTSYPTAPLLRDDSSARDYEAALSAGSCTRPLSLYFHLPFCKSLCYYCGCHMMVTSQPEKIEQYLAYLLHEVDRATDRLNDRRVVSHVHWGGGTPTFLSPDQMERLIAHIHDRFRVAADAEIGIEADPRTLTPEHLRVARAGGFNRISLGVQDLDPLVQETIGRIQPEKMVRASVDDCRSAGFSEISLDLIYGLPHQTQSTWKATLEKVLALEPDRLSVFSYAHVPWIKKHQRVIPVEVIPSPEAKLNLFLDAIEVLTAAGYRHVGMDHFARPDDPLCRAQDEGRLHRNFQGYATDAGCDLLGFGISSISQLDRLYVQNEKALNDYYRRIGFGEMPIARGLSLSDDDVLRRYVIMRLMCDFHVDRHDVETQFGIHFDSYFDAARRDLSELQSAGLVFDDGAAIGATEIGRLFIRNVAMAFDAYLKPDAHTAYARFSQTV